MITHPTQKLTIIGNGSDNTVDIGYDNSDLVALIIQPDNARRLVACWNRLSAFSTEDIENPSFESGMYGMLMRVTHQRDVLQREVDAAACMLSMSIKPGDLLCVKSDNLNKWDACTISENLRRSFPALSGVIFVAKDGDVSTLSEDEMRKAGWVRDDGATYKAEQTVANGAGMPIDPPDAVIKAAMVIGDYVRQTNITHWRIGECCSEDYYADLERRHLGDPDKGTGIYAPRTTGEPVAPYIVQKTPTGNQRLVDKNPGLTMPVSQREYTCKLSDGTTGLAWLSDTPVESEGGEA